MRVLHPVLAYQPDGVLLRCGAAAARSAAAMVVRLVEARQVIECLPPSCRRRYRCTCFVPS